MSSGRIYRIVHLESELCYIGSTMNQLKHRWQQHKYDYQKWLKGTKAGISIYPYFKEHGMEKFKLILIKEYEVFDRKHLAVFEQLWINRFRKTSINQTSAFAITKLTQKRNSKVYREKNKDQLAQSKKNYYEANKESILAKLKVRSSCDCGGRYSGTDRMKHERTIKHKTWLATQNT